jgi:hypothetical protein
MAEVTEQSGEGTLFDTDDNELASVAYRVRPFSIEESGQSDWGGEISLPDSTMTIEPGMYILTLDDGTPVDIDVAPLGSVDGDARHFEFTGVGAFGRRFY